MRKIDKLIIGSFIGPFILTFFVVVFILLTQFMLKYFDEIVGKDLDASVIAELIFYFSVFMTPNAFPLAVLLSSLMTFGNLGEHFEMTAIKSAGISMTRTLVPLFVFSAGLTWLPTIPTITSCQRPTSRHSACCTTSSRKSPPWRSGKAPFTTGSTATASR
jgi:lipopolysaccharide export system permease protein